MDNKVTIFSKKEINNIIKNFDKKYFMTSVYDIEKEIFEYDKNLNIFFKGILKFLEYKKIELINNKKSKEFVINFIKINYDDLDKFFGINEDIDFDKNIFYNFIFENIWWFYDWDYEENNNKFLDFLEKLLEIRWYIDIHTYWNWSILKFKKDILEVFDYIYFFTDHDFLKNEIINNKKIDGFEYFLETENYFLEEDFFIKIYPNKKINLSHSKEILIDISWWNNFNTISLSLNELRNEWKSIISLFQKNKKIKFNEDEIVNINIKNEINKILQSIIFNYQKDQIQNKSFSSLFFWDKKIDDESNEKFVKNINLFILSKIKYLIYINLMFNRKWEENYTIEKFFNIIKENLEKVLKNNL